MNRSFLGYLGQKDLYLGGKVQVVLGLLKKERSTWELGGSGWRAGARGGLCPDPWSWENPSRWGVVSLALESRSVMLLLTRCTWGMLEVE